MSREPGVSSVKVDIKKGTTTIVYLTDRNGPEQLKTAITNDGFDADEESAEETAYKKLPACCKKPVVKADSPGNK
jgi:copper chaperone CopZ